MYPPIRDIASPKINNSTPVVCKSLDQCLILASPSAPKPLKMPSKAGAKNIEPVRSTSTRSYDLAFAEIDSDVLCHDCPGLVKTDFPFIVAPSPTTRIYKIWPLWDTGRVSTLTGTSHPMRFPGGESSKRGISSWRRWMAEMEESCMPLKTESITKNHTVAS